MMTRNLTLTMTILLAWPMNLAAREHVRGNRFAYLDEREIYHPGPGFPKIITPMWADDPHVDAVIILSIDDMADVNQYNDFLTRILRKLAEVEDGRSPMSIMTNRTDPYDPILQSLIERGVSIETHTTHHPCPLLCNQDFDTAVNEFISCVETVSTIPNNSPVAFRMPCCDSNNTVSPRFFSEIFNRKTRGGRFLSIDSSIFNVYTLDDPEIDRRFVIDHNREPLFNKYIDFQNFTNFVENYPYPYVIHNTIWEFPCAVPSDWEAQRVNKRLSPVTTSDMGKAIDATVQKKGVYTLVFHPHGWMDQKQVVLLVDHAKKSYGDRVRFMSFADAADALRRNLLGGMPIKTGNGLDNGIRLLDVNNDGYMDVVTGNAKQKQTRVFDPARKTWTQLDFPVALVDEAGKDQGVKFVDVQPNGNASFVVRNDNDNGVFHFTGMAWTSAGPLTELVTGDGESVFTSRSGIDRGLRGRDVNGDQFTDLVVNNDQQNAVYLYSPSRKRWEKAPFALPAKAQVVDDQGRDQGLRFLDLNADRKLDLILSNDRESYVLHFVDEKSGWSKSVHAAKRGDAGALPAIVSKNLLNGVWFRNNTLYLQNETTDQMPGNVFTQPLPTP
jgi:hypothetical protein